MMRIKLVGRSGLRSSEIALGAMTFGDKRDWGTPPDEAEAILAAYVEHGGTTIDTAPNYASGASEEIVGRFARSRRDELVISTKYTGSTSSHPLAGGNSRRAMVQSVEASLRRLDTDRIDLLWLHFWDFTTPLDEVLRAADDLVRAGKILYFGLSDTPAWLASRAVTMAELTRSAPVVALQLEYNAASRDVEQDFLPMAKACDLGVFCWGPLAAGALAAGSAPQRRPASAIPAEVAEAAIRLQAIAGDLGRSTGSVALRWIMQSGLASCFPIIGARSGQQLSQMLGDIADPLDDATMQGINGIAASAPTFPNRLIQSSYLRKFAFGDASRFNLPVNPRN
ncbi:MAG: aldo/keto reductase [Sphingorhabdus sp.]|nr:aldo/keto reductase [Sphingorhabdus sp.]